MRKVVTNYTTSDAILQQALTVEFQNVYKELSTLVTSPPVLAFDGGVTYTRNGNTYSIEVLEDSHSHDNYYEKSSNLLITSDGGLAIKLVNKTGGTSVVGSVLALSTSYNDAVVLADASTPVIGIMSSVGVEDGRYVWVTVFGKVKVRVKDGVAVGRGVLLKCSDVPGSVDVVSDVDAFTGYSIGYSSNESVGGVDCTVAAILYACRW